MAKILLIDDDVELASLLQTFLQQEGFTTDVEHEGLPGVRKALSETYELIVLDVMLPDLNGIEVLSRIRGGSAVPVIMLTAKGDDIDRIVGLEMGADDYLPKPCIPRELLARVRAVLRRTQPQADKLPQRQQVKVGPLSLWPAKRQVNLDGTNIKLTSSEYNLLEILMEMPGEIISKEVLCERGLGRNYSRYDRSVDVHISSIRKKLQQQGSSELIETVHGRGYQLIVTRN